jgi:uncharacterized membrane protein YfcA
MESHDPNSLFDTYKRLAESAPPMTTTLERADKTEGQQQWTPSLKLSFSFGILAFGLIVIVLMAYLLRKGHSATSLLRLFALPLIITSAVFLIVVGYTEKQIAPVLGLLGTIAGYLLGSGTRRTPPPGQTTIEGTKGQ